MGELDAGELAADLRVHRFVVERHGIDLPGEVRRVALDATGVADAEVAEIQLDGSEGLFLEEPDNRPDPFLPAGNDSINERWIQGKRAEGQGLRRANTPDIRPTTGGPNKRMHHLNEGKGTQQASAIRAKRAPGISRFYGLSGLDNERVGEYYMFCRKGLKHAVLRGAWRSPVARLLWEQDVGGSNPLAPTI